MTDKPEPTNAEIVAPLLEEWARLNETAAMVDQIVSFDIGFDKLDAFICKEAVGGREFIVPLEAVMLNADMAATIIKLGYGQMLRSNRDVIRAYLEDRFHLRDEDFRKAADVYKEITSRDDE